MDLIRLVDNFIDQPIPLWENDLTEHLIQNTWSNLKKNGLDGPSEYSTARSIKGWAIPSEDKIGILDQNEDNIIYLEAPSFYLKRFYEENMLVVCSQEESIAALPKLKSALDVISLVKPAYYCVQQLVRSVQVLKQENPEIDLSHSDPQVAFSIFVSVCKDETIISNIRVAESILHESMHLKLTLIEAVEPLVTLNTDYLHFSPWRGEKRPAQGVLHGLFVFRVIYEFYSKISQHFYNNEEITYFIRMRLNDIYFEIKSLEDFIKNNGLTSKGRILVTKLVQLPSF